MSNGKRQHYKVILLGNLGVGKTSMFRRLREGDFSHTDSHVGVDKHTKAFRMESGETVFLDIWDTAGMEGFRTVTRSYYNGAKVVVMVYDITTSRSFFDLGDWLQDVSTLAPDAILVLIGNKFDQEEEQDVDPKTADSFAAANGIKLHFKVSVKENQGVQEAFQEIAKYLCCGGLEMSMAERNRQSSILLHEVPSSSRKSFCVSLSCARP